MTTDEYDYILSVLERTALVMERSPSAFSKMEEEDIRWQILVQLNGHYDGQVSGEAFRSRGKTDILMPYSDGNAFVAECKFWSGPKDFLATIDQLLGYCTWRDTKTAIVIFNKNKDLSAVLAIIREAAPTHGSFLRESEMKGETHFRFVFHLPGDPSREVHVAVLIFDVPTNP